MKTNEVVKAIKAIAENGYYYFGIRHCADDENYNIGDICRNSYDWDYEYDRSSYDTDKPVELNGTCALALSIDTTWDEDEEIAEAVEKGLKASGVYPGEEIIIIAGRRSSYGEDEGEIIIENAVVIAKC